MIPPTDALLLYALKMVLRLVTWQSLENQSFCDGCRNQAVSVLVILTSCKVRSHSTAYTASLTGQECRVERIPNEALPLVDRYRSYIVPAYMRACVQPAEVPRDE